MEKIDNVELWQSVRQYLRSLGKKDQKPFGLEKEIIVEKVLKKVISENFDDDLRYIIFSNFSRITNSTKWVMAYRNGKYEAIASLYKGDDFLIKNSLSRLYINSDIKKILRIKVVNEDNFSLNQNQTITLSIPNNSIDRDKLSDPKDEKEEKNDFEYYNYDDEPKRTINLCKPDKWDLKGKKLNEVASELLNFFGNNNSANSLTLLEYKNILHSLHAALYFKEIKNIFYIPTMEKGGFPSISIILFSKQIRDDAEEIAKKLESIQWILSYLSVIVKRTELGQLLIKASTKSAITTIMSRNGSHNIGSHVLAAVGNNYNDLPDDQILFKYIQHRMDYIAQIATEFPDWTNPTWFVRDLMRRFYLQRHLLNYVANSEGLKAYEFKPKEKDENQEHKIIIKIGKKVDDGIKYIISPKIDGDQQPEIKEDVQIAIPGGIIGHQAFYTILENIIRNAAKHGWALLPDGAKTSNLEITIEIDDKIDRNFVIFRIYDNVSNSKDNDSHLIDTINKNLVTSFIHQETGKLLKSNWGLAEMKISAGFLNRRETLQIGSDNKNDILFKLDDDKKTYSGIIKAVGEECKSFGYEFAVPRPREVLIVGAPDAVIGNGDNRTFQDLLLQNSIYLEKELTNKTNLDNEFVVMYDDGKNDFINKLKDYKDRSTEVRSEIERFPFRLFIVSDKPQRISGARSFSDRIVVLKPNDIPLEYQNSGDESLDDFKLWLFKKWIRHLMKIRKMINEDMGEEEQNNRELSQDKDLRMLIHLVGNAGHSDEDIVKLIFRRFKNSMLSAITNYKDEKARLKKVTDDLMKATLEKHKCKCKANGITSTIDTITLIDQWENAAIQSGEKLPPDLMKKLTTYAGIYFQILKDMYTRYDEDCQTLPRAYRGRNSNQEGAQYEDLCIDDHINISITQDEDAAGVDIAYNRHDIQEANYYSEALSGSQVYFSLLQNLPNENKYNKTKTLLQLVENALLRVVIIDERVAQYYCNCNDETKEKFKKGLITIPTQINHDKKAYPIVKDPNCEKKTFLFDNIFKNEYDIFIIHQGMLDKIGLKETGKVGEFIDKIKESVPFVIITSGRGEPENIPENAKFLPFSNIESFLLSNFPEKYLLTQMMMKIIS